MKPVLNARALDDLKHIFNWIAADDMAAARGVVARIFASIERLAEFPEMDRAGRVHGTRE